MRFPDLNYLPEEEFVFIIKGLSEHDKGRPLKQPTPSVFDQDVRSSWLSTLCFESHLVPWKLLTINMQGFDFYLVMLIHFAYEVIAPFSTLMLSVFAFCLISRGFTCFIDIL